jgi:hypothetical protein
MSEIARLLTGLDENQLREYDFRRVDSKEQLSKSRGVRVRQNVRFETGLTVGTRDFDAHRKKLSKSTPKSLEP